MVKKTVAKITYLNLGVIFLAMVDSQLRWNFRGNYDVPKELDQRDTINIDYKILLIAL